MRLVCALVAAAVLAVGLAVALTLRSNSTGVIEFGAPAQIAVLPIRENPASATRAPSTAR